MGKTAVVTGADKGIGRAVAVALASSKEYGSMTPYPSFDPEF